MTPLSNDIAAMQVLRPVPRISIQAFCETDGVAQPIERAGEDRRMAKAHLKVHMGGVATAIEFYQTAPTPNLIILESRASRGNCSNRCATSPNTAIRAPRSWSSGTTTTSGCIGN